jgi:hypothetical protein
VKWCGDVTINGKLLLWKVNYVFWYDWSCLWQTRDKSLCWPNPILWHWYKLIDVLCKYKCHYRLCYHATYAHITKFSLCLIKNYAMRGHVGVEVYFHAFSTTTLIGSEFGLYAGGSTQKNDPSAPTVQDVGWGPSVVILNVHMGTRREFRSRWREKKGCSNYILMRFAVRTLHQTLW